MATIGPQSYRTITTRILKGKISDIAHELEAGYHSFPDYKDYSDEELTNMMIESIRTVGIDEKIDYEVIRRIMIDYAKEKGMSSFNAHQIVNISLGSASGEHISSLESRILVPVKNDEYYSTVFDTLNKIIKSLKSLGVGPNDPQGLGEDNNYEVR